MPTPALKLSSLVNVKGFKASDFKLENDSLWIYLRRDRRFSPICSSCGRRCGFIHDRSQRVVRDLARFGLRSFLCFEALRVACKCCGAVRAERIDWLGPNPRYTRRFAYQVARLTLAMPISAAAAIADISWHAARAIMEDVCEVEAPLDQPPKDLRFIGVDEKSWRRGHRYVTVVTDLVDGTVIWLGKGRGKETLERFFDWIGKETSSKIEAAAIDLAQGYEQAVRQRARNAKVVFDRYHVIKLLLEALNTGLYQPHTIQYPHGSS